MEVQLVYSTKLNNNRFVVRCIRVARDIKTIQFIIDTGAQLSCIHYSLMDNNLCEEDISSCETKIIRGVIEGESVKLYKYCLKQFTVGNINMGEQDIWITFDKRVTDTVLGMDILQKVVFIVNSYDNKIYFCKDAEDYEKNFKLKIE